MVYNVLKKILAIIIILFSIKNLFFDKKNNIKKITSAKNHTYYSAGFIGGLLDSFLGTGGPPIIILLSHLKVKKAIFRATCVMTFIIFHISRLGTYIYSKIINKETIFLSLIIIPAMLIGSKIGMILHNKVNENLFKKIVNIMLFIIGISLIV